MPLGAMIGLCPEAARGCRRSSAGTIAAYLHVCCPANALRGQAHNQLGGCCQTPLHQVGLGLQVQLLCCLLAKLVPQLLQLRA